MRFINNLVLNVGDNTLRVYTNSRKFPFIYQYILKTWQLEEGDSGENLTKAVIKFCKVDSMETVIKDYTYKYYLEKYKSQVDNINSRTSLALFKNAENPPEQINILLVEPIMETIIMLKEFVSTYKYEEEVNKALAALNCMGSEEIINTAMTNYEEETIAYEELNKIFYKYIDYVRKYDEKVAQRLDKQMDIIYKKTIK